MSPSRAWERNPGVAVHHVTESGLDGIRALGDTVSNQALGSARDLRSPAEREDLLRALGFGVAVPAARGTADWLPAAGLSGFSQETRELSAERLAKPGADDLGKSAPGSPPSGATATTSGTSSGLETVDFGSASEQHPGEE